MTSRACNVNGHLLKQRNLSNETCPTVSNGGGGEGFSKSCVIKQWHRTLQGLGLALGLGGESKLSWLQCTPGDVKLNENVNLGTKLK